MNWRVGLPRLWVVFLVLWLMACGAWGLSQWHAGISFKYALTDPNGLKFIVTAPVATDKADILPFARNSDVVKKWQADCKERSPSLGAAAVNDWTVASMTDDWKRIFKAQ